MQNTEAEHRIMESENKEYFNWKEEIQEATGQLEAKHMTLINS